MDSPASVSKEVVPIRSFDCRTNYVISMRLDNLLVLVHSNHRLICTQSSLFHALCNTCTTQITDDKIASRLNIHHTVLYYSEPQWKDTLYDRTEINHFMLTFPPVFDSNCPFLTSLP